MYYTNTISTAVVALSELIDDIDDLGYGEQIVESCRDALRLVSICRDLSLDPNRQILRLCRSKSPAERATAVAVLFRRAHRTVEETSIDAIRLNAAEGMMWGATALLYALSVTALSISVD